MKKTLCSLAVVMVMLMSAAAAFVGCGEPAEAETLMTVNINPSVEFTLDKDNKVVSVAGLNDEGEMLIVGEAFVGKTAEEAAQLVVQIATETGYLVKGSLTVSPNTVEISVTADTDRIEEIYNQVAAAVEAKFEALDIDGMVEQGEAMTKEALVALAQTMGTEYTVDELNGMSIPQLCRVISLCRLETADLFGQALEDAYYQMKNYKFALTEYEETAKVIDAADSAYQTFKDGYDQLLKAYQSLIEAVEQARYNNLIDSESAYQKALAELAAKKNELIEDRAAAAQITDEATRLMAEAALKAKETAVELAEAALSTAGDLANSAIDVAVAALEKGQQALVDFRETLPEEIKTELNEKAQEIEDKANQAKDNFFAEFEAAHADDIAAAKAALQARKDALKQAIAEG